MNPLKPFLPAGRLPRTVRAGVFRGLRLHLDLRCELQVLLGLYERETFSAMRRLAQGCHGFIDIGAAKGEMSIYFLRQPGIDRVVAAEPAAAERELFVANLALNGVSADPRLHLHAGFAGAGPAPEWATLDQLATDVPAPLFLKIDIDGPEAALLDTGRQTLATKDCRLLIETHSPEAEARCAAILEELGYTVKIIANAWWRFFLPEQRSIPHNRWSIAWRPTVV
jgi:hypothetical protein